jgi:glucose-6-phosphate dehydrogenase assembly protein OpcA
MSDTPAKNVDYGVTVPLHEVEREIGRQMQALQADKTAPVLRARMSNQVIFCHRRERADSITVRIHEVVAVHPSRVLLLVGDGDPAAGLTTSVRVRSHTIDKRAQMCSEQVTISVPPSQLDRLPFAVRALVIGDLPTNLWWASHQPPPLGGSLMYELAEHAQQIIYDSLGWEEPARGVAATANWLEQIERTGDSDRWRVASDLNWRRLKYWRRLAAQALEPGSAPGAVESMTEILLEHGPHAVVQGWLLLSWLAQQFGWKVQGGKVQKGVEMVWRFTASHGDVAVRIKRLDQGPPEIRRVHFACRIDDKPAALNLLVESADRLAIVPEGIPGEPRTITLPPVTPAELIARQLSDRERDPVFRESMNLAQVMAQSLL